jgi:hypothetical protein
MRAAPANPCSCLPCPCPCPCSYGVSYYKQGNDFGWLKIRNRVAFKTLEEQVGWWGLCLARQLRWLRRRCRCRCPAVHMCSAASLLPHVDDCTFDCAYICFVCQGLGSEMEFNVREVKSPDGNTFRQVPVAAVGGAMAAAAAPATALAPPSLVLLLDTVCCLYYWLLHS